MDQIDKRADLFWSVKRVSFTLVSILTVSLAGAGLWHYRSVLKLNRHLATALAEVQHQRMMIEQTSAQRQWYEDELRTSAQQLQALSRRLLEAHERERRAIARELHDEIGQVLTGLKLTLSTAAVDAPEPLATSLNEAHAAMSELLARVRALTLDLRPALLDDLGLLPALGWFLDRYVPRTGIKVDLRHSGIERRFPSELETTAYRTIQEALTNVARHAGVDQAKVRIFASAEQLVVQVSDDGIGFASTTLANTATSGGLSGMRERIQLIGGTLSIEAQPGEGTEITAELPLPTFM
ncbi:sensor histidine kinase [Candidatus Viridilinea mediisalina]|uniref:Oxygen sensor histidine kinase NreB n=1 Tax=Candidatus Viridilinea mediisalina TaxID=2024553 RepID=A0A2A6RI86_9CHLR|nr:sensor histidine kinase [Candidatus Viridilinea mediisalina]PDW02578.1 hypothetical protein CJ255_13320 [Candidatus Viridilinea mediisalina]